MRTDPSVTTNNYGLILMNLDKYKLINVKEQPDTLNYSGYLRGGLKSKSSEYIIDTLKDKTPEQLNYYYSKDITKVVLHLTSCVLDVFTAQNELLYSMKIVKTDHYNAYIAYVRTLLSNTFNGIQYNCLEQTLTYYPNKNNIIMFEELYLKLINGVGEDNKQGIAYKNSNMAYPVLVPIKLKPRKIYEVTFTVKQYDIFNQELIDTSSYGIPNQRKILLNGINIRTNEIQLDCVIDLAQYLTTNIKDAIRYSYVVELTIRDCSTKQLSITHHSQNNYYLYLKNIPSIAKKELVGNFVCNIKRDIRFAFRVRRPSSIFKTILFVLLGYAKFSLGFSVLFGYFLFKYHRVIKNDIRYLINTKKDLNQSYAIVSESNTEVHSFTEQPCDNVTSSIDDASTTEAINTNIETAVNISTLSNFILNTKTCKCDYLVGLITSCHDLYKESLNYKDAGLANFNRMLKAYIKNMLYLNEVYINQYKLLNKDLEDKIISSIEELQEFMMNEMSKMKQLNNKFNVISRSYLYDKLTKLSNEVNAYKEI